MPSSARHTNRLGREKSPYLLQHAHNPVDWYPWGDEAFDRARREDKPVFLSIGYSTCHWCHVMERESFDDEETAGRLNEAFVCVKVDREERPDLDQYYMAVCQALTGSGGWPLTVVLTPDRKPFFAGTYFPKIRRWGRPGLMDLIPSIRRYWAERREEVLRSADEIASAVISRGNRKGGKEAETAENTSPPSGIGTSTRIDEDKESAGPNPAILREAFVELETDFDPDRGGFGQAPKFPTPHNLTFLLRYWKMTGETKALAMVETTLRAMRRGGISDQLGFGIHRYSTDAGWLVPHFEKMLYDQALLVRACIDAFLATGKDEYRKTAFETLKYVLRDMTSPRGGFYSAEDADSEGEEGRFYLWTADEVREVVGGEEASFALEVFGARPEGNFAEPGRRGPDGRNILHRPRRAAEGGDSEARLEGIRDKLFRAREKRVRPFKDTKILADWNGLMIGALAAASRVADDDRFVRAAEKAARFVLDEMRDRPGGLRHAASNGEARVPAFLDDYAFLADGLIELYESTFDLEYLEEALVLVDTAISSFWDDSSGGFFFVRAGSELPYRRKELYDGAIPSGNSVMLMNLLRLARLTGRPDLEARASEMNRAFADEVRARPRTYTAFLGGLTVAAGPSHEVVIVGPRREESTAALRGALARLYLPNAVVLFKPAGKGASESAEKGKSAGRPMRPAESEGSPEIAPKPGVAPAEPAPMAARVEALAPFTREMRPARDGRAAAYVCTGGRCREPLMSAEELIRVLSEAGT